MLVVLYIISAVSGVFASIYIEKEKFKHWLVTTLIAILTGIAFCWCMFNKIANGVIQLNFGSVFSILSLIAWQLAFLFGNYDNIFDYEFAFALFACTICLFYLCIIQPYTRVKCTAQHITKEVVFLVTSFDDSETEENVYGGDFIVCQSFKNTTNSKSSSYLYYYQLEDGTPKEGKIPAISTEIEYIGTDESPYLEITIIRNCSGYYPITDIHSLGFGQKTYKLYIPENSILKVLY